MTYYRQVQACGVCWLGPCLCAKQRAVSTAHKIIPAGKDDHVFDKPAGQVRAETISFVNAMREEYNAGVMRRIVNGNELPTDRIKPLILPGDKEWYD